MTKATKIKTLLASKQIKGKDVYSQMGLARQQALTNKYSRDSFSGDDLIRLAEITGTTLAFINNNNNIVVAFDKNDINKG